ncbi:AMP-binding protein [Actinosynnema sp. NPDC020468]|uniref:AMP-binding protein n=1 Tax=Actinosynnema sp. NPDC020468 TaxID=3154488 RepID=UPI0033D2DB17
MANMGREPGIRCGDVERGYPEFRARAARVAGGLAALGVGPGDAVALVLRNSVEFLELSAGVAVAGANPVPVNWHWSADELGYLLADCKARVVFAHKEFAATVAGVLPPGAVLVEEVDSWIDAQEPLTAAVPKSSALGVVYTSGTTGRPKGVVREPVTDEQLVRMAMGAVERMGLREGGSTLIPAPLYHMAPNTLATIAVTVGLDVTLLERFDPEEFLAAIERHRIEQVQVVPTMFVRLLRLPEEVRARYDLSSLRRVVHSAAPCPPKVKRAVIDWLGPIVWEYYGGSEMGAVVWCDSETWLERPGTVGLPVDGAAVRVIGSDGRDAPVGEVGSVYVRPAGYWPDFTYLDADDKRRAMELEGFITVGDLGRLDADGYLYLADRADDMLITGGVNVYPAEIEAALSELDGVRDSAVFGVPDEEFGQSVAAHVEVEPGSTLTEDDVRAHVRRLLAGYKVPKVVVLADKLPRDENGKLYKRLLRA